MRRILLYLTVGLLLILFSGCSQNSETQPEKPDEATATSSTDQPKEDICPYALKIDKRTYICYEELTIEMIENFEQIGVVQSYVAPNEMPKEDFQTNMRNIVGRAVYKCEKGLLVESNSPGNYYLFS